MPYINDTISGLVKDSGRITEIKDKLNKLISQFYAVRFKKKKIRLGIDLIETAGKQIGIEELVNGVDAVLDGWWTDGRYADQFTKLLTAYLSVRYALLTNSGSSANLVAFSSLTSHLLGKRQIKKGDEVVTIAAAFPTTVNPIIQLGCIPVFVDIDLTTLNIDCNLLSRALSKKTRAIMIAHTQGNPFNLDKVMEFAKKNNLWLIEDCCDALGAQYNGKKVGGFGDLATFSFYPAHQATMGEGGAVVTNNPLLFRIAKSFRDWGRDCWCETGEDNACRRRFTWKFDKLPYGYDHKFVYSHLGYNLKLTDIQAAIGCAQIKKIDYFVKKRRENYTYLKTKLAKHKKYFIFQEAENKSNPSWFGFMMTLKQNCPFKLHQLVTYLNENKIATRPLYCGNITLHPYFDNIKFRSVGNFHNTNYLLDNTFWIGIHPKLDKSQMNYIVKCIGDFINQHKLTANDHKN